MAGGLAGSVVSNHFHSLSFFRLLTYTDGSRIEICLTRLPRTIHLLRICQRFAECCTHAFGRCTMDGPEHKQRV